nr:uncharacterized protein LOC116158402 [Camelus dromedarius]
MKENVRMRSQKNNFSTGGGSCLKLMEIVPKLERCPRMAKRPRNHRLFPEPRVEPVEVTDAESRAASPALGPAGLRPPGARRPGCGVSSHGSFLLQGAPGGRCSLLEGNVINRGCFLSEIMPTPRGGAKPGGGIAAGAGRTGRQVKRENEALCCRPFRNKHLSLLSGHAAPKQGRPLRVHSQGDTHRPRLPQPVKSSTINRTPSNQFSVSLIFFLLRSNNRKESWLTLKPHVYGTDPKQHSKGSET